MTTGTRTFDGTTLVPVSTGNARVGIYHSKTWSGTDDPLKKRENQYTMSYGSWSDQVCYFRHRLYPDEWRTTSARNFAEWGQVVIPKPPQWDSNDELSLILKLKQELSGSSFNFASSIGAEGHDALKQITGSASSLAKSILLLRKGNFAGAARAVGLTPRRSSNHAKNLSGNVLAVQLGWLPLVSDMKSAAESLANIVAGPKRTSRTVTMRKQGFYHNAWHPESRVGDIVLFERLKWTLTGELSIAEKLSMADVPVALYNAVPMSFVLDWVIPIGDYLEAVMFAGYTLTGSGVRTTFVRGHADVRQPTNPADFQVLEVRGMKYTQTDVSVNRRPITGLTVPFPSVKTLKDVPSWRRALTAVSLVAQRLL